MGDSPIHVEKIVLADQEQSLREAQSQSLNEVDCPEQAKSIN